jgi:hypothetical protein
MIKKSTTLLLSLLLVATVGLWAGGSKESKTVKTSKNFDFSTWKLQLPEPNADKTSVKEVMGPELTAGYFSDYFYYDKDGAIVFYCPVDGFKTANTTYSRSELRELIDGEHSYANWSLHGTHIFNAVEKVTQTSSNGRSVVSQIHGVQIDGSNGPVLVKVEYDGSQEAVVVLLKTATYDNAADERHYLRDVKLNEVFNTTIKVVEGRVFVTVTSGDKKLEASKDFYKDDPTWDNYRFYFKVGNYVQDSIVDYAGESATVKLYKFNTSHTDAIETVAPTSLSLPETLSMEKGNDVAIKGTFTPFDTSNIDCKWQIVSGDDVIALSSKGQITARKEGSAVIKATSVDNVALSDTCTITVTQKTEKTAKIIYDQDFEKQLGSEWTFENAGEANVSVIDGKLSWIDTDKTQPSKAILTLEDLTGTSTIQFDVDITRLDIKDKDTAKEQSSYYYFDVNSASNENIFRIRNKADLNAGQLLDSRIVLSRGYLDPEMNEDAAKTPVGTSHTITMIIRTDDHSAKANTTDTYIDGIKIGERIKNNSKQSAISRLEIFSGTKDMLDFSIDNLKIYEGEMLPGNAAPSAVTIDPVPSYLEVSDSTRITTSDSTTFKVIDGADFASVSDSGLVTGLAAGKTTIDIGNQKQVTITIINSLVKPETMQIAKESVILTKGESENLQDLISILPENALEKDFKVSVLDGDEFVSIDKNIVTAKENGTANLMITSLGNASLIKYLTISVVTNKEKNEVLFADSFDKDNFDTNFWNITTANNTDVSLTTDKTMKIVDDSTGGLPKAYVTFSPMASTFTISYKFMLLADEQVSGTKLSCFTFALGADKITSTANEAFRFKTNGDFNEATGNVDNRRFIYSKEKDVSGFYDIEGLTVERNKWYEITLVTTPGNSSPNANTTDIYIDGVKVVDKASNKRIIPTYDKIIFETGTKDRTSFLIDDLSITVGNTILQK